MDEPLDELVQRSRAGHGPAFAELIRRYERPALAVAYATLADASLAADAVQEAFMRAWSKLATLREPARFVPWLMGIVRHAAADLHRQRGREGSVDVPADAPDGRDDPPTELGRMETARMLARALHNLDEISRTVVVLRYYQDLSSRQIGALLDLSPAAVDMRLMRARQELRRMLSEESSAQCDGGVV